MSHCSSTAHPWGLHWQLHVSHGTVKITTLPPRMIHDAAEGLPSCYLGLLERELRIAALEEHMAALGSGPRHCLVLFICSKDAFPCQVKPARCRRWAPCTHPACSVGSQLPFPAVSPHRDHVHPALGCCRAAVVAPWASANAVQDLATVLSPGSPGGSCPCAVGLGSGGVRIAPQWDELQDRLAVALGAPQKGFVPLT